MIKSRAMLLAGVSALAMLACVAKADAETFIFTGGVQSFPVLVSGEYSLDVLGASGGTSVQAVGGLGAEVSGDISLTAGETLTLFVGGQGQNGYGGDGGGGFVFLGTSVLAVAGGGGGATFRFDGGAGQAGTANGTGGGANGGAGGASGSGGGGGTYLSAGGIDFNGGGGAGADSGAAGYGGAGTGSHSGFGAKFPNGGADGGGGGGGNDGGGGGGGGLSGGGGGSGQYVGDVVGSGGGGSYLSSLFTHQSLTAGVHSGDGSIDIELLKAVPEPSTWAMTLAGFAGLGWLARMRRRKISPA
jgi:PEP-CTERM motif